MHGSHACGQVSRVLMEALEFQLERAQINWIN